MTVSESKLMAVINITCDYPNRYSKEQLANWANVSSGTVTKLCDMLKLETCQKGMKRSLLEKKPITGKSFYFK